MPASTRRMEREASRDALTTRYDTPDGNEQAGTDQVRPAGDDPLRLTDDSEKDPQREQGPAAGQRPVARPLISDSPAQQRTSIVDIVRSRVRRTSGASGPSLTPASVGELQPRSTSRSSGAVNPAVNGRGVCNPEENEDDASADSDDEYDGGYEEYDERLQSWMSGYEDSGPPQDAVQTAELHTQKELSDARARQAEEQLASEREQLREKMSEIEQLKEAMRNFHDTFEETRRENMDLLRDKQRAEKESEDAMRLAREVRDNIRADTRAQGETSRAQLAELQAALQLAMAETEKARAAAAKAMADAESTARVKSEYHESHAALTGRLAEVEHVLHAQQQKSAAATAQLTEALAKAAASPELGGTRAADADADADTDPGDAAPAGCKTPCPGGAVGTAPPPSALEASASSGSYAEAFRQLADTVGVVAKMVGASSNDRGQVVTRDKLDAVTLSAAAYPWLAQEDALGDERSTVTPALVLESVPRSKTEIKAFTEQALAPEALLKPLLDGVKDHLHFVDFRASLLHKLAKFVVVKQCEGLTATEAEHAAADRLLASLEVVSGKDTHAGSRLTAAHESAKAHVAKQGMKGLIETVLRALDDGFAAQGPMQQDLDFGERMAKVSIAMGVLPSAIVEEAVLAFQRRYADPAVWQRLARSFILKQLISPTDAGMKSLLEKFVTQLSTGTFDEAPLTEWRDQFRKFERMPDFASKWAALTSNAAKGTRRAPADKDMSAINLVMGLPTVDLGGNDLPDGPEHEEHNMVLRRLIGQLAENNPQALLNVAGQPSGHADGNFLRQLIATIKDPSTINAVRQAYDAVWVAEQGCPKFKAPDDATRPAIHVGKVAQARGLTVSAECPKDPRAFVGFHCPCNQIRKIPFERCVWPDQNNTADKPAGAPLRSSLAPGGGPIMQFHRLGRCRWMHIIGHELARKDPANEHLLQELPRGTTDCITIA